MTIELTQEAAIQAFVGGATLGLGAAFLLLFNGRIAGVAGIARQLLNRQAADKYWRLAFLFGLVAGGFRTKEIWPASFPTESIFPIWQVALAGIIVGYGVSLGNGCTSGHGVCGVSRFSKRSIVATLIFMATGFLTVFLLRVFGVLK